MQRSNNVARRWYAIAVSCALLMAHRLAGCKNPDPATGAIIGLNASIARAYEARDAAAITRLWAPDYVELSPRGDASTRGEAADALRASVRQFKKVSVAIRVEDVHTTPIGVTATIHEMIRGMSVSGANARIEREFTAVQTWAKVPHGWLLKKTEVQTASNG